MVRLFLKFYGVLIATLVLSFVVQSRLMDYVWSQLAPSFDYRVRLRPTFHLLEQALAPLPAAERGARFDLLTAGFGLPARVANAAELPERARMPSEQLRGYESGRLVTVDRPGGFTAIKRLEGTDLAAAIDMPAPDNTRVKVISYALNWVVEFAMVAVLVWFWVRPFWIEILGLRRAAEAVGGGQFEARATTGKRSALRSLAESFNAMAEKLAALVQSHRTLTSAVSHELRTPIARLRFSHSLAREESTAAGKDRYLARMERDIAEIDELTTELLDYARLERGAPRMAEATVPTAPWIEDVVAGLEGGEATRPAIETTLEIESIRCEPRYMARAVGNLLRNAAAHARSRVHLKVREEAGRTVIDVEDDGPGIPASDRERLFEPFVRMDRSRGRESGGFGLGLAIVRQVARWHGGDACIGLSSLGGARVSIAW